MTPRKLYDYIRMSQAMGCEQVIINISYEEGITSMNPISNGFKHYSEIRKMKLSETL